MHDPDRARRRLRAIAAALAIACAACSRTDDAATQSASPAPPATSATQAPATAIASATDAATFATHAPSLATHAPSLATRAAAIATKEATVVDNQRITTTKNGVTSSMGAGTQADVAELGLPLYPSLDVRQSFVVKHVDATKLAMTLQGTVTDSVSTVEAYYTSRLGSSFRFAHMSVLGGIGSFTRKTAKARESVLVQTQDATSGSSRTSITLTVTRRR